MTTAHSSATSNRPRRARWHPLRALAVASVAFGSVAGFGALTAGSASALKLRPRPPVSRPVLVPPAIVLAQPVAVRR